MKMTRPWTGKKDSQPDQTKKELHKQRKETKLRLKEICDEEWEQQLKDFYASKSFQE